jgi:hypothetical protein
MDDSRWRGCQRQALQVPWMAATTGLGQVFKRCTGHLGERRPKEIIFEFNQKPPQPELKPSGMEISSVVFVQVTF